MTDRYYTLTVSLEHDTREDDAAPIIQAIKMIKGVLDVNPLVTDARVSVAETRARHAIAAKVMEFLRDA